MLEPLKTLLWTSSCKAAPWIVGIAALSGAFSAYAQTTVAGELAGQFSVSESGAATYQIPIQIPPGVAGVEPKLELAYNSQGGNGPLGMGWSLSGLSAIARCPRTKAQDGVRGSVNFELNDRYCLDGERLIRVAGVEGVAGAEYRTERDGFSRIIANGQAGNGPASFTVKTKAGQTLEYGNTADSRIEAQGKTSVSVWAVNRISDTRGTAMTVSYDEDAANGSFYPLRIDYAGGALLFDYEARTDFIPRYQAGSVSKTTKRLMAIRTLMPDASLLRKLSLTYASKGVAPVSVVTKIEVCDAQNICLAPTTATYETGSMSWTVDSSITPIPNADLDPISSNSGQIIVSDWNGDGRNDFLWWESESGTNIWYVSNGDGAFTKTTNLIAVANMKNSDGWSWLIHPMDWNGDGLLDFVLTEVSGKNRWFTNNGGLSFSMVQNPIMFGAAFRAYIFGDWNGDGFTDVAETYLIDGSNKWFINNGALGFTVVDNAINPATARFASNSQCLLKSGDWNGDGITDVMCVQPNSNNNRWFINDGTLQFAQFNNSIPAASLTGLSIPYFVDINGDGSSDVMWYAPTTGQNKWFLNDGKLNFSAPVSAIAATEVDEIGGNKGTFRFGDWNGDGITDALWYEPNSGFNRWYIGKGDLSFVAPPQIDPITSSTISGASMGLYTGDWTGKGLDDVMIYNAATGSTKWFRQGYKRDWLIKSISTSSSKTTTIFIDSLNVNGLITKDSGANKAVFPQIDIQPAMPVVSRIEQSDGLGSFNATSYTYGGLKVEVGTGRGMLGFRWVRSKELATWIESYTEYYQSFPYTGTPKLSETRHVISGNAGVLKRTTTTAACQNPQNAAVCTVAIGNRYFPYASLVQETSWDLNGTAYPGVSSNYVYGVDPVDGKPYGDPTQITVTNQGDNSSKTTVNEYWPANTGSGNWILGRLKKATVTSVKP